MRIVQLFTIIQKAKDMKTAYSTTVLRNYAPTVSKIANEINKEWIHSNGVTFAYSIGGESVYTDNVYGVTAKAIDVPPFSHPITFNRDISDFKNDHSQQTFVDVRTVTRLNRDGTIEITQLDEFNIICARAALENKAVNGRISDLLEVGNFPIIVYMRWLGQIIGNQLSLEPVAQLRTSVIAAAFFITQFEEEKVIGKFSERAKARMASIIAKGSYVTPESVLQILNDVPAMNSIEEFVEALKQHGGSIRFERFNAALLAQFVSRSWWGDSSGTISGVALEHPPTFLALVYAALQMHGYKDAPLSNVVKQCNNKGDGTAWAKGMSRLIKIITKKH